jgi:hypothetical protein
MLASAIGCQCRHGGLGTDGKTFKSGSIGFSVPTPDQRLTNGRERRTLAELLSYLDNECSLSQSAICCIERMRRRMDHAMVSSRASFLVAPPAFAESTSEAGLRTGRQLNPSTERTSTPNIPNSESAAHCSGTGGTQAPTAPQPITRMNCHIMP